MQCFLNSAKWLEWSFNSSAFRKISGKMRVTAAITTEQFTRYAAENNVPRWITTPLVPNYSFIQTQNCPLPDKSQTKCRESTGQLTNFVRLKIVQVQRRITSKRCQACLETLKEANSIDKCRFFEHLTEVFMARQSEDQHDLVFQFSYNLSSSCGDVLF